jgi:SsrA-binding protein
MIVSLIENKRAYFDYEILEKFTAGIELLGQEVKSLRLKRGSLEGSRVLVRGGEAYVVNMEIPPYQPNNKPGGYDDRRTRRLLLLEKEIKELANSGSKKGLTIVPISVYNKGRFIKMDIGLAKGKKNFDKRESIKKRESDRDIRRSLKRE